MACLRKTEEASAASEVRTRESERDWGREQGVGLDGTALLLLEFCETPGSSRLKFLTRDRSFSIHSHCAATGLDFLQSVSCQPSYLV